MCPDPQLLSVYFDEELPPPWNGKMETHLAVCPRCRQRLEEYRRFSPALAENGADDSERRALKAALKAAQERIWRALEARQGSVLHGPVPPGQRSVVTRSWARPSPLWGRSVSVPVPVIAVAAAVLIIALVNFWLHRPAALPASPAMTVAAETEMETPGIIPVSDMNSVLQYLGGTDSGDILILRLPESRNFFSAGEPAIINAADYSRSAPVRRKP